MNKPYLIQRLKKPGVQTLNAFGGGYKNGGLSEEASDSLKSIWSFDYMGAAEFEYGAIPESLDYIQSAKSNYIVNSIEIDCIHKEYIKELRGLTVETKALVYYVCKKTDEKEVINWLKNVGDNVTREHRTKEYIGLPWCKDIVGWHDIKNHFLFFIDKEMCDKFCKLIELTSHI